MPSLNEARSTHSTCSRSEASTASAHIATSGGSCASSIRVNEVGSPVWSALYIRKGEAGPSG